VTSGTAGAAATFDVIGLAPKLPAVAAPPGLLGLVPAAAVLRLELGVDDVVA
jgi:hypothetical protein